MQWDANIKAFHIMILFFQKCKKKKALIKFGTILTLSQLQWNLIIVGGINLKVIFDQECQFLNKLLVDVVFNDHMMDPSFH